MEEELVRRILASQFPEVASTGVRFLAEGEDFRVFECDGLAWRFPKRAEVESWLLREGPLLDAIGPCLGVSVPHFRFHGRPGEGFPFAFAGYSMLDGVAADQLPIPSASSLAGEIGRFLSALHSIPPAGLGVANCGDEFSPAKLLARAREACRDVPPGELREFLAGDPPVPRPGQEVLRLIHGDFEAEHILVDPATGRITGILDWSDACVGDPARDFGGLWAWGGDAFLDCLLANYTCPMDRDFMPRLRFLGRCFALLDYREALVEGDAKISFAMGQLDNVFRGSL